MGNLKIGHTKKTTANITLQKPIKKTPCQGLNLDKDCFSNH